jgi:hypothetical protein
VFRAVFVFALLRRRAGISVTHRFPSCRRSLPTRFDRQPPPGSP